jgi:DNA-binding beta-propeller fold protein YncE
VVVDTDTASIIARLDLGLGNHYPVDIVFDRTGNTAYISDRDAEQVTLVDVATHSFTGQAVTGPSFFTPGWMAVHPINGNIYMTDWQGSEIYVFDPISLAISTTSYPSGSRLRDLKFAPDGSLLYVANGVGNDQLLAIDPNSMAVVDSAVTGADP